jgi:hypothetical protein
MTCDACRDWIFAALDGAADPAGAMDAGRHLAVCPACRTANDAATALRATLREAFLPASSAGARDDQLLAALSHEGICGETRRGRLRLLAAAVRARIDEPGPPAVETTGNGRHEVGLRRLKTLVREGGLGAFSCPRFQPPGQWRLVTIHSVLSLVRRATAGWHAPIRSALSHVHRRQAAALRALASALPATLATMAAAFLITWTALRGAETGAAARPAPASAVPRMAQEPDAELIERWLAAGAPAFAPLARLLPVPPSPPPRRGTRPAPWKPNA